MTNKEKLELLQSLSHKELKDLVLIDLFDAMNFQRIRDYHGPIEGGKDLVFFRKDPIAEQEYIAVVVETAEISGDFHSPKGAPAVYLQIERATSVPYSDLITGNKFVISKCYVVTPHPMNAFAKSSIDHKVVRFVQFIDGPELVSLIDKYKPDIFEGSLSSQNVYVRSLYTTNYLVKNLRQLGAFEDKRVCDIYTGGDLVDFVQQFKRIPQNAQIYTIFDLIEKYSVLYIFGVPGAGKTLALQKAMLDLISNPDGTLVGALNRIPVYIRLYSLDPSTVISPKVLLEHIGKKAETLGLEWSRSLAPNNELILMFDGFDEISSNNIQKGFLECLSGIVESSNIRCIVTSRYYNVTELAKHINGSTVMNQKFVTLVPFGNEERNLFIQRWFKHDYKKAEDLKHTLSNNVSLRILANTPLLLTLITILHEAPTAIKNKCSGIPNKALIYDSIADLLLERWDKIRELPNIFQAPDKKYCLEELAYFGQLKGKKEFTEGDILSIFSKACKNIGIPTRSVDDLFNEICIRSSLLIKNENGNYEFYHFSFQEYFCGWRLVRHNQEKEILSLIRDPWWFNSIEMYAGLKGDISGLFLKLLRVSKGSYDRMLLLAKCVHEAKYTDEELKTEFFNKIVGLIKDMEKVDEKWISLLVAIEELFWLNFEYVKAHMGEGKKDVIFRTLAEIGSQKALRTLYEYHAEILSSPPSIIETYIDTVVRTGSNEIVQGLVTLYHKIKLRLNREYLPLLKKLRDAIGVYPKWLAEIAGPIDSDIKRLDKANILSGETIKTMSSTQLITTMKSMLPVDLELTLSSIKRLLLMRNETFLLTAIWELLQQVRMRNMSASEIKEFQNCRNLLRKAVKKGLNKVYTYERNINKLHVELRKARESQYQSKAQDIQKNLEKSLRKLDESKASDPILRDLEEKLREF